MPAGGGEPKQLTFYPARGPLTPRWGYDNQVYGWTPDGKSVFFRSLRDGFIRRPFVYLGAWYGLAAGALALGLLTLAALALRDPLAALARSP